MSSHPAHYGHMMPPPSDSTDAIHSTGYHMNDKDGVRGVMHMAFYASPEVTLLFNSWEIKTAGQMIGACVGIFVMGMLFEGLRAFREHLYSRSRADSNTSLISDGSRRWTSAVIAPAHLVQTVLYGLQITLGYLLMLIFMTYNVYACLAIVLGATFGFLLFGWRKCLMFELTADHCG
ncbi:high affinity copper uptake protein 1-like [Tropilaelaps mercedesae]|uniref:Copper transport protein n=1 Tax=Tropilaelaps mercedesae TaxID=418985 RepID=A0A1V9XXF1_9ACAR|nr:high affinity copper uptake protein 1-like [Tropilaelaps mercedesae]